MSGRSRRGLAAVVMLLAGLVYLNALDNPFIYDDVRTVQEDRSIEVPTDFRTIVFGQIARPVVNFSYAIDRAIWGPGPFGFHVTNVLIHVLNVGLLFGLTIAVTTDAAGRPRAGVDPAVAAFTAAALFGVHPLMTEAVGYVSGRSDLVSATFILASVLAAVRWMDTGRGILLVAVYVAWVLAVGSKETAVVVPLVLAAYDSMTRPAGPFSRAQRARRLYLPMFVAAGLAVGLRAALFVFVEYRDGTSIHWTYVLTMLDVFRRYVGLLVMPSGQTVFHAIPEITSVTDPRAVLAIVLAACWLALVFLVIRRGGQIVGLGLAWFALFWFAVGLIPSGTLLLLNHGEPMAERRVYLASIGFFLAGGCAAGAIAVALRTTRRFTRVLAAVAGLAILASLAGRTVVRNAMWSSPVLLWGEAAERAPTHWLPALVLGESLHAEGRHDEAIRSLATARRLRPDVPAVYEHLGLCQLETGALEAAAETFSALQAIDPRSAAASNGLAMAALLGGDREGARRGFLATLDVAPRSIEARRGLVLVEEAGGVPSAEAFRRCEEIKLLEPDAAGVDACLERHRAAAPAGEPR